MPTVDEAIDWLVSIDEIQLTGAIEADIREYAESSNPYPKRYKIRPRVYFIIIKTEAATMQDFKDKKAVRVKPTDVSASEVEAKLMTAHEAATAIMGCLSEDHFGWYEGTITFKRVLMVPGTGKYQYRDTTFTAACKAQSPLDAYERIVDHLRGRVDPRSQFPSVKGKNFRFRYLGDCKEA